MSVFTGPLLPRAIRVLDHAIRVLDHALRVCALRVCATRVCATRVLDCAIDGAPATSIAQSRSCGEAAR